MRTRLAALVLAFIALPVLAAVEKPTPPADLVKPPADAERQENGLVTKKLADGTGTVKPGDDFIVRVRYTVWKPDGTLVQHVPSTQSLTIAQSKMIPGWEEAVRKMVVGEKRRVWIPSSLSAGKIAEGDTLIIDTELVDIIERPTTPPDVAAPPADATTTPSGLAYKVLRPGTGKDHPKRSSTVTVHYSGWTADGKLFDSSVLRSEASSFTLDGVIAGWTEALQLMTKGEKTRFWIPAKLAYQNEPRKPQGTLVFDIDLIDFR
jgi:peptidylprolyl isomerase